MYLRVHLIACTALGLSMERLLSSGIRIKKPAKALLICGVENVRWLPLLFFLCVRRRRNQTALVSNSPLRVNVLSR
jgi:hypothetical protein